MTPWDIMILAKTHEAAEKQLKAELAKRTAKHIEVMTPLRVWIGLMPIPTGHVMRVECRGYLNGTGAKIMALVETERLYE